MSTLRQLLVRASLVLLGLAVSAPVFAQSQALVTVDRATIWRNDVSVVVAVARSGTILQVVAQWEKYYEVVVPEALGGANNPRGLVAMSQVMLQPGSPPPPVLASRPPVFGSTPAARPADGTPAARPQEAAPAPTQAGSTDGVGFRLFGQGGLTTFAARKSFEATLGRSHGFAFGGGGQVRFPGGLFVEAAYERFKKTGHRVFVFEGEAFPLDTPNAITIEPLTASVGMRVGQATWVPYVSGGIGSYRLREESPFVDEADQVDERHIGYHFGGGVEWRGSRWLATGIEGQFAIVPDGLGSGGVSEAFDESNLGGFKLQFKLLIGQ